MPGSRWVGTSPMPPGTVLSYYSYCLKVGVSMLTLILPFSLDALRRALDGYLSRPTVEVEAIVPERLGGGTLGNPVYRLRVTYRGERGSNGTLNLVLKKGMGRPDVYMMGS